MSQKTARFTLGAAALGAMLCLSGPLAAGATEVVTTSQGEQVLYLGEGSGYTVAEVVQTAIDSQGEELTSAVLEQLAQTSAGGTEVSFPGLEDLGTDEAADALINLSDAVQAGSVYIADEASLTTLPTATVESVDPTTGEVQSAEDPAESSLDTDAADDEPMMSIMAATPGGFSSTGEAISGNRAWRWTNLVQQRRCTNTCTIIDQKTVRSTITPYNRQVRIEQQTTNVLGGSGISAPKVNAYVWRHPSTVVGENNWTATVGHKTWYVATSQSLFTTNTRIIVGTSESANLSHVGNVTIKSRTLTATCFAGSQSRCEWWV